MTEPNETPDPQDTTDAGSNAEAARYRRKLREAESERDTLRGQLDGMRRAELTRLAADRLVDPGDWLTDQLDLSPYLSDDGTVNADAVAAALDELTAARPHWAKVATPEPPRKLSVEQLRPALVPRDPEPTGTTWAALLGGDRG